MKTFVLVFLFGITSALGADDGEIGRFQVVSGTIEEFAKSHEKVSADKVPVMIKIDTKTGNTWILVTMIEPKKGLHQFWDPL